MTQPDRFTRIAMTALGYGAIDGEPTRLDAVARCRRALLCQHAQFVRLVQGTRTHAALKRHQDDPNVRSYCLACDEILTALANYRKGTP